MRKHYLDNIRWITVIIVLIYHVFYLYNSVGVLGGMGGFLDVQYQDSVLYFVYPWFMVLLFVIAGISSKYALEKKSNKQFIKDRTVKLLVPSTLGLLAFQWISGYFNVTIGGGWEFIPSFIQFPIMILCGVGPLWFIQLLWVFSLLLVLIRKIDKNDILSKFGKSFNLIMILLLFIPIWLSSKILNAPVITTYRFGIYFLSFLIGYYIFSNEEVMEKIEKIHIPTLVVAVLGGIAYTWYFFGTNYSSYDCLESIFTNMYLWIAVIAILGCGKAWLNKTSAFASYMSKSSFGIYIVHYAVTLTACYCLKTVLMLPAILCYTLGILITLVVSPLVYEVIKRIPIYRFFVLGIKTKSKKDNTKQALNNANTN